MLKVTTHELKEIILGNLLTKRFDVIYNGITPPYKGQTDYDIDDFREDDGRTFDIAIFFDRKTGIEYQLNYVNHPEHTLEFPIALFEMPEGIEFVKESELFKKAEEPIEQEPKKDIKDLSVNGKENNRLTDLYNSVDVKPFDESQINIPSAELDELRLFCKNPSKEPRSILDIRIKFLPVCTTHEIELNSLWRYIQNSKK